MNNHKDLKETIKKTSELIKAAEQMKKEDEKMMEILRQLKLLMGGVSNER